MVTSSIGAWYSSVYTAPGGAALHRPPSFLPPTPGGNNGSVCGLMPATAQSLLVYLTSFGTLVATTKLYRSYLIARAHMRASIDRVRAGKSNLCPDKS